MERKIKEVPNIVRNIKIFRYRWVIILIFGYCSSVNLAQIAQFTIIGDIVKRHYEVDYFFVNLTGLVFMITFLIFFIPVAYIVENTTLKKSMIFCVALTAVGNCLKYFAASDNGFYLIFISQTLCAIAQIFFLITPSKIAGVWFGAKEVSTACAFGVFGTELGESFGYAIPTLMVERKENEEIIVQDLKFMFECNAMASIFAFIFVLLFFRSRPLLPPSHSQAELLLMDGEKMTYLTALKEFAKNRDFIIVLISLGLGYGMWSTFGILVNQIYMNFFPNDKSGDLGIICFVSNLCGGCFGTIIFGYIFDKLNNFKWVTFFVLSTNFLSSIGLAIAFLTSNKLGVMIFIPIFGFFSGSLMVISYEYAIETTYPIPEAFGTAILTAVIYIIAITYEILLSIVFDSLGYFVGEIIIIFSLAVATYAILFISPELRRKKSNINAEK